MRRMVSEEAQKALKQIKASPTGIEVATIDSVKSIDSQEFPNGVEGVKIEPGEVSVYENDDAHTDEPTHVKLAVVQDGDTYWPEISMMADGGVGHTIGYKHETDEVAIDDEPIATVSFNKTDASGITIDAGTTGGTFSVSHFHAYQIGKLVFVHTVLKQTATAITGGNITLTGLEIPAPDHHHQFTFSLGQAGDWSIKIGAWQTRGALVLPLPSGNVTAIDLEFFYTIA